MVVLTALWKLPETHPSMPWFGFSRNSLEAQVFFLYDFKNFVSFLSLSPCSLISFKELEMKILLLSRTEVWSFLASEAEGKDHLLSRLLPLIVSSIQCFPRCDLT